MTRGINPFGLRMPDSLRADLEEAAERAGRSLNAEIVRRLQSSTSGRFASVESDGRSLSITVNIAPAFLGQLSAGSRQEKDR